MSSILCSKFRRCSVDFDQGNVDLFRETARWQYACNALYSILRSVIRKISVWELLELDHTLIESDKLCLLLNCENYLSVNELPRKIIIFVYIEHLDIAKQILFKTE